jgi:isopenicillin-N N-acyltransferase-like protein
MTLPVVRVQGSPKEQGQQHGEALRDRVIHNVRVYLDRFGREFNLSREAVLERAAHLLEVIRQTHPAYLHGMEGIALGSGCSLLEIAMLNARYEILYYQQGAALLALAAQAPERPVDGCTAFAVLPEASANGHVLIGQNWDWLPEIRGAVVHSTHDDLATLAFTEAGIFGGKIGLNSAGVGLCINGMNSTADDWSRVVRPVHVRCHDILRSSTFMDATAVITDEARGCSTNFLVAQAPNHVADLEAAPPGVHQLACENGVLAHANHFVNPSAIGVTEPPSERRPFSRQRQARMTELLSSKRPIAVSDLQTWLRDRVSAPAAICRHPDDPTLPADAQYATVAAVIADLEARTLFITDGPPDQAAFVQVSLA